MSLVEASDLLRGALLGLSKSDLVRTTIEKAPVSRDVVARYVPGTTVADAVQATAELRATNRLATLDYLGEDTTERAQAEHTRDTYVALLDALARADLSQYAAAEVSLKLSALGQYLPKDGDAIALDLAGRSARLPSALARRSPSTWRTTRRPIGRSRFSMSCGPTSPGWAPSCSPTSSAPSGIVAISPSPAAGCGCARAPTKEPASVAYQDKADVDLSYVRCLKVLMAGEGHPMVASHDPRLIEIAQALAAHHERTPETYEFQMLYGIRPDEQKRIADRGAQMRVYIPFGDEWYGLPHATDGRAPRQHDVLHALADHQGLNPPRTHPCVRATRACDDAPRGRKRRCQLPRHTCRPWEPLRSSAPASWGDPALGPAARGP